MNINKAIPKLRGDKVIWALVLILALISLLAVYSATCSLAYKMEKNTTFYLFKHLCYMFVGLATIYFTHKINYTRFISWSRLALYIAILLLIYTLIYGTKLNHGSRWVSLPVVNITFQSSDFAKLALFVYLAKVLSLKQEVIKDFYKGFIPVVFPVIVICVLILPANLSTALMLGFTCCILFYIGRVNVKHILILAVSGIALIGLMILFNIGPRAATWKNRILTYVSAEKKVAASDDDKEDEFQAAQAKIAIANGGLKGLGPGKSMQRNFLPHPYSDFIYAIIIEEYGLLGGAVLMFIYMLFLWRCIRIFQRCPYAYGAFLAVGLSITLVFQAMLNMGVNTSLLPVTGLTLPMVSMGGSSIWFTSIAIGIILSVSSNVGETEGTEHKISELNKATN